MQGMTNSNDCHQVQIFAEFEYMVDFLFVFQNLSYYVGLHNIDEDRNSHEVLFLILYRIFRIFDQYYLLFHFEELLIYQDKHFYLF